MKLPIAIAQKILELAEGLTVPASRMRHEVVTRLLADGILSIHRQGRRKAVYYVQDAEALSAYLSNHFGIGEIKAYVQSLEEDTLTRADAVRVASDSKIRSVRTFKGFPINCYATVEARLGGNPIMVQPQPGLFIFIYDFETFVPSPNITIVGVENPENFRFVERQKYFFAGIEPLFVCLYPRSKDLIKWLLTVSNPYIHYGDFDFAGISIFLNEYKKHLGQKAQFFIPENINILVKKYGNRKLYNTQLHQAPDMSALEDPAIIKLVSILHAHKKGLEQEILINEIL